MKVCDRDMSRDHISGDDIGGMEEKPDHSKAQHDDRGGPCTFEELKHAYDGGSKIEGESDFEEVYFHQKQPSWQSLIFIPNSLAAVPTSL